MPNYDISPSPGILTRNKDQGTTGNLQEASICTPTSRLKAVVSSNWPKLALDRLRSVFRAEFALVEYRRSGISRLVSGKPRLVVRFYVVADRYGALTRLAAFLLVSMVYSTELIRLTCPQPGFAYW